MHRCSAPRCHFVVPRPAVGATGQRIGPNEPRQEIALGRELLARLSLADQELCGIRDRPPDPLAQGCKAAGSGDGMPEGEGTAGLAGDRQCQVRGNGQAENVGVRGGGCSTRGCSPTAARWPRQYLFYFVPSPARVGRCRSGAGASALIAAARDRHLRPRFAARETARDPRVEYLGTGGVAAIRSNGSRGGRWATPNLVVDARGATSH